MDTGILAIGIFAVVYLLITLEVVNKAVAALGGAMLLIAFGVIHHDEAVENVDFETILLLLGMMSIVAMLRRAHFFTIISVKIAALTKGSPLKILILFSLVTAVLSAFLDNVTTVLIIIPIIVELTAGMGLNPRIFVISQALISNIGGASTLIGDPPNIIIGSKVNLTFVDFMANLLIPCSISFVLVLFYIWVVNREKFRPIDSRLTRLFLVNLLLEKIRYNYLNITFDYKMLTKSLGALIVAVLLFMFQSLTHISPGVVAVFVAMMLMVITRTGAEEIFEEVEWATLLFFIGLFVLVGALEKEGVIDWLGETVFLSLTDNPYIMVLVVLWFSGLVSGFLDNIPFTITMIPIIQLMQEANPIPSNLLWWALSLGACLGGNLTMIGASANIVSVGSAAKSGCHISFLDFMKVSVPVALLSLVISSIYLMTYLWMVL